MSSASYNTILALICAGTCLGAYLSNSSSTPQSLPHSAPTSDIIAPIDLVTELPSKAKPSPNTASGDSKLELPEHQKPEISDHLNPYAELASEAATGQTLLPAPEGVEPLSDAHIRYDLERRAELYLAVTYGEDREESPSIENLSDGAKHRDGRARVAYDSIDPYGEPPTID